MNLLDIMTSKDLDRPGVLPDDAVDMRKEWVHEGAALFFMEEQAKSVRDLIGNLRCADDKKMSVLQRRLLLLLLHEVHEL